MGKTDGYKGKARGGKGKGKGKYNDRDGGKTKFITTKGSRPKHEKLEIKFNPAKRVEYLTGLSAKKKERRAFGLAMQKVKDRKARLEDRRDQKEAITEQIEDAERQKKHDMYGMDYDSDDDSVVKEEKVESQVEMYGDASTKNQFGGQVIVTTSYGLPSDSDDDDDDRQEKKIDSQQRHAGSVQKYIDEMKGNLPNLKKHEKGGFKKGQHGAAGMIGGTGQVLKMAQRTLKRVEASNDRKGKGKKGKKGKGKR
mmetsp:Transcript_29427/g.44913  ORF Transcript_29427/g.44913 Transcript_29427/m.44913 type:complete len:253 (-) Transcript_29427:76-834(-)|eukprot:CAMPEP_0194083940 /NCGR_PEP_ID=MMETSP0149-20130528/10699_1 /TAXON_ID=122233 /ORGANISM="Chaetoceros debilis, Strain MM31A-1" /LENGTH=252 /DNA_ID=CAMNT_0038766435 /DNA_START=100 /DNA_END=861 /DNA_ORIENTATION=+